ncbi:MAG TPA: leucyl/phenylalanyl-tRNA--protein transferase [Chloroflexota bacterium]|nr:leucyl/phenylalanyl-tRNA--protein transferase [Chloroflexota bacterium]
MPRLTPELVLGAYCRGLFPMARSRRGPIEWFRPDPRAIFDPYRIHLSRRLLRTVRSGPFDVRINADFAAVIAACAARAETWISPEVERVYGALHARGFAHSVEAYQDGALVGGLYGVAIGGAFMGESMFHDVTDASKVCFAHLAARLRERGYLLLDTQFMTDHLASLGAYYVSAAEYDRLLARALHLDCRFA